MAGRYRSRLEEAVNDLADVLEPLVWQLMADVFAFAEETLRTGQEVTGRLAYLNAAGGDPEPGPRPWTPDDAAVLPAAWEQGIQVAVVPTINSAYDVGALTALARKTPAGDLPSVMEAVLDQAGREYLQAANNRLVGIGDTAWRRARKALTEDYANGASIDSAAATLQRVLKVEQARAETIARTEMVGAANAGTLHGARLGGFTFKQWLATLGPRTRPTHAAADGQVVPIDDPFTVGAGRLDHPGDPSGPAGEVINCRCTLILLTDAEALALIDRETGGPPDPKKALLIKEAEEIGPSPDPLPPKPKRKRPPAKPKVKAQDMVRPGSFGLAGDVDPQWVKQHRRQLDAWGQEPVEQVLVSPGDLFAIDEKVDINGVFRFTRAAEGDWSPDVVDDFDPVVVARIGDRRVVVNGTDQVMAAHIRGGPAAKIRVLEVDLRDEIKITPDEFAKLLRVVDGSGGIHPLRVEVPDVVDLADLPADLRRAAQLRADFARLDPPGRLDVADKDGYGNGPSAKFQKYEDARQDVGNEIHNTITARMKAEGYRGPGIDPGGPGSKEVKAAELRARDATSELQSFVYDEAERLGGTVRDLPSPDFDPISYVRPEEVRQQIIHNARYRELRGEFGAAKRALADARSERVARTGGLVSYEDRYVDVLNDVLNELGIDTGPGDGFKPDLMWDRDAPKTTGDRMREALFYYPRSLIETSIDRGRFALQQVPRGFYNAGRRVLAISGRGGSGRETAVHEFGHRIEDMIPAIRASEWAFYKRRTKGESLTWLGSGYENHEKTREDEFANAYMGKPYGLGDQYESWELWTMVAQQLLWKPDPSGSDRTPYARPSWGRKLHRDRDMVSWWLGTLVTSA